MSSIHNSKNLHKSFHSNDNYDFKKSQEYKRITIMNELLLSNPELLEDFRRRHSRTPGKLRIKNQFSPKGNSKLFNSKNISLKESANLKLKKNKINPVVKNQYSRKIQKKNNFREMNTSPLMRHVNVQVDNRKANATKNRSKSKNKNNIKICDKKEIKNNNVLSRSESFSILDKIINNDKEASSINDNKLKEINSNKENNQNNDKSKSNENLNSPKNNDINNIPKKKNKVIKKIYKIESLSQVGYSGPGIVKYNQDNFFCI